MAVQSNILDGRLFYKLNMCQRGLLKHVDKETMNRFGVPVTQVAALFHLLKNNGCLLKDLCSALPQNKSATTTLVTRMEKNGLIVKKQSKTDGRAFNLSLTDKGCEIGKQALPMMKEFNHGLLAPFSNSESEVIHRFLDTIIKDYN